ncbi:MAG: hypothetical protein QNJ68_07965 [Microcoleaceae cyanobacterium MO_207.B10]|nr:hypothetical protein [Microcoleaceae cyanobacterium MO_207.B10]
MAKIERESLNFKISKKRAYQLRKYAAETEKSMTQIIEEFIDLIPRIDSFLDIQPKEPRTLWEHIKYIVEMDKRRRRRV